MLAQTKKTQIFWLSFGNILQLHCSAHVIQGKYWSG